VEVKVTVPRHLTPRQQHLLQELAKEEPESPVQAVENPGPEGLLKKLWNSVKSWHQKP
jgi:DnaJ-class molecular chaperone